jgi:hypothetical protein
MVPPRSFCVCGGRRQGLMQATIARRLRRGITPKGKFLYHVASIS